MSAMIQDQILTPLRLMNKRQFLHSVLSLLMIVTSALMIWKSLTLVTGSESPVVVVLSGSMEPTFYRGDILFLYQSDRDFEIGEIVVFKVEGKDIPIVHRIHEVHNQSLNQTIQEAEAKSKSKLKSKSKSKKNQESSAVTTGKVELLTKGDNNQVHDHWGIYNPGQMWLERKDIMGRAVGFLPYFGWVTIGLTDFPLVKYALLGVMGLFVILSKDQ